MILTAEDDDDFFPSLQLTGVNLDAAIRSAQMLAEGFKGANRPLEVRSYSETHKVAGSDQTFMVSNLPIVLDPYPVVKIRQGQNRSFGRSIAATEWVPLESDQFQIDEYLGEIQVLWAIGVAGYPSLQSPSRENANFEAQITYSSGFNFHPVDPAFESEANMIKQAVANIMLFQNPHALPESQSMAASGASNFTLNGFYSVGYSPAASQQFREQWLDQSLSLLQRYQPRGLMS
jgi:hypothetical protein